jgi:hypothetical protein
MIILDVLLKVQLLRMPYHFDVQREADEHLIGSCYEHFRLRVNDVILTLYDSHSLCSPPPLHVVI